MRAALSVFAVAAACHEAPFGMDEMRSGIDEARVENTRHRALAQGAADVETLLADVDRHEGAMEQAMRGMHHALASMTDPHCGAAGMADMTGTMDILDGEMSIHRAALGDATTLEDARAACETHALAVDAALESMEVFMGQMAGAFCL